MSLKTDYKDEILRDGEDRRYNLVDENGRVVYSNIKLDKAYTPQQEGDEFNAKDVNEIHGRLNGLAPMNLLINGDFQCNQRGQSEYTNKSSNIVYTLDMWYLLWGTIKVLDKGIKIMPTSGIGYFQQFIDTEIISNKVTICAKINDIVYTRTGTVSKTESITLENENFNIVFQYVEDKYKVNLVAKKEVDVEYIDLFDGDIAYPHVKEDNAIALMRCQEHVLSLKGLSLTIGFGIIASAGIIGFVNTPVSFKSLPSLVIKGKLNFVIDGVASGTINDAHVRGLTSNGVCIDFKSSDISRIGSGKVVRLYVVDDTSSLTITNEAL